MLLNKYINSNYQCLVLFVLSGMKLLPSAVVKHHWWTQISEDRAMFSTLLFWWENVPRKHAASNPEAFWLQPVMAITTSMQPESSRIVYHLYASSNFTHPFQLCFSKESMDHNVQNQPRSDLDGLVRVWPNKSGLEASWCAGIIGPGFWQDATSPLPVSDF